MDRRMGLRVAVERLAQWWAQASAGEKTYLLEASIRGDAEAPPLDAVHYAAYLAESEQGTVDQGEFGG
jgi:hypothetical protein